MEYVSCSLLLFCRIFFFYCKETERTPFEDFFLNSRFFDGRFLRIYLIPRLLYVFYKRAFHVILPVWEAKTIPKGQYLFENCGVSANLLFQNTYL